MEKSYNLDDSQDRTDPENIKRHRKDRRDKPPKKITESYLHNSGLAYLQRFPASTPHFRRIMTRKIDRSCTYHKDQSRDGCMTLLEKSVENFIRIGLLNDDAYTQGMVNSLRRRGLSSQAIFAKLQQKGLTQTAIQDALKNHGAEKNASDIEIAAAIILCRRKRIGPFRSSDKNGDKELASLARAGFGFDIAKRVLDMDRPDADNLLTQHS